MYLLGYDVADALVVGAPSAAAGLLGWFGRQRTAARVATVGDRRVSLDEFTALVRAYHEQNAALEREVGRLTAEMTVVRAEMRGLHEQNVALERENILLRTEVATLSGQLARMRPARSGRRATDAGATP